MYYLVAVVQGHHLDMLKENHPEPQYVSLVACLVVAFVIVVPLAVLSLADQQYIQWIDIIQERKFVLSLLNFFLINLLLVGWVYVQVDLWGSLVQDEVVAVR